MGNLAEKLGFFLFIFTVMNISSSPYPFLLVISYIIHEVGHLAFAKLVGARVTDFKTSLCRLNIKYDCSGISYLREAAVCGGGIIFNFIFALIFSLPFFNQYERASFFSLCNAALGIMNLYPVNMLDGGNVLRCVLNRFFSEGLTLRICAVVSFIFIFIFWLFAVYLQLIFSADISFFLISVFLLIELCFSV